MFNVYKLVSAVSMLYDAVPGCVLSARIDGQSLVGHSSERAGFSLDVDDRHGIIH